MDNFMKLVSVKSEHIKVVDKEKCRFKTGEEVLVIDGAFKGVRGKVARVSSEQRVVIELTSHWLIATAYINGSLKFEITAKRLYAASQRVL